MPILRSCERRTAGIGQRRGIGRRTAGVGRLRDAPDGGLDGATLGAAGVERRIEIDERVGARFKPACHLEIVAVVDDDLSRPVLFGGHGTRCSHASVANFDATSSSASAYSSALIVPRSAP